MGFLCPPTAEAIEIVRSLAVPVVEVGAGDGEWVRAMRAAGISCVAYDLVPRGEGVSPGDHLTAGQHRSFAMLAVWPPDGAAVQSWIAAAPYPAIVLVACFARLDLGDALDAHEHGPTCEFPLGPKGRSELRAYRRCG